MLQEDTCKSLNNMCGELNTKSNIESFDVRLKLVLVVNKNTLVVNNTFVGWSAT